MDYFNKSHTKLEKLQSHSRNNFYLNASAAGAAAATSSAAANSIILPVDNTKVEFKEEEIEPTLTKKRCTQDTVIIASTDVKREAAAEATSSSMKFDDDRHHQPNSNHHMQWYDWQQQEHQENNSPSPLLSDHSFFIEESVAVAPGGVEGKNRFESQELNQPQSQPRTASSVSKRAFLLPYLTCFELSGSTFD